ncbi:DNA-3-methyladenine glycosylase [Sanguibacter sp. A247]|uniref:DNA-3-methyladenine glycosylase n=1 Tax=unclassified Sanguibacter TaxID=2645534 RepID=UPI003FD87228
MAGPPCERGHVVPARGSLAGRATDVVPLLLGALVVSSSPQGEVVVRLTEVEAYQGGEDPGSHAFRGMTARNAVMFGPAGHLYAYRHLGLHTCVNVVCGPPGEAAAVLLRAGEVVSGGELAWRRRAERGAVRTAVDLARGPARLTVALGIDVSSDGLDLLAADSPVRLLVPSRPVPSALVRTGPRVGVSGEGGRGDRFPWRFWLEGEPTVSTYRRAAPRRRAPGAQ